MKMGFKEKIRYELNDEIANKIGKEKEYRMISN